jgi:hypothetical protein
MAVPLWFASVMDVISSRCRETLCRGRMAGGPPYPVHFQLCGAPRPNFASAGLSDADRLCYTFSVNH